MKECQTNYINFDEKALGMLEHVEHIGMWIWTMCMSASEYYTWTTKCYKEYRMQTAVILL